MLRLKQGAGYATHNTVNIQLFDGEAMEGADTTRRVFGIRWAKQVIGDYKCGGSECIRR